MVGEILIPVRFYGYDTVIYLVSALIGFWISYRAMKLHEFSGREAHKKLYTAFAILGVGMLTLALTTAFTYLKYFQTQDFILFNGLFDIADMGYWIYFLTSFVAYALLISIYAPGKEKFGIGFIISFNYYLYFNLILFFMIAFVAFRAVSNHFSKKSSESKFVALGFVLIALYHALQTFTFVDKVVYVAANLSLILGFLSLLIMLIRVNK